MLFPLIAVTATTREWDGVERVRLNQAYVTALEGAGLVPLVLPPLSDARVESVIRAVAGLVLTGGEDIEPSRYGESRHARTHPPHARRDEYEIDLLREARRQGLPTLAICRGVQLVNVALGGSLVQDVPSEWPGAANHEAGARDERIHEIRVDHGSRLAEALQTTTLAVNSSHHQALKVVADGLLVSAVAPDGVIEGIEWHRDDWWMLGVQWHPEELVRSRESWDRNLFAAFAAECSAWAARPRESVGL